MKLKFLFSAFLLPLLFCLGCNKEAMIAAGKAASSETQARLKAFPDLIELHKETEGVFQLTSMISAYGFTKKMPPGESITGTVFDYIGSQVGIDAGNLTIGTASSKTVPYSQKQFGVYYQAAAPVSGDDIFGKTVAYKMQKDNNPPLFEGELKIPTKIGIVLQNPGGMYKLSRTNGQITWNPDATNEIGVGVQVLFADEHFTKTRGEVFLVDDDGVLNVQDFLKSTDNIYTQATITLIRGNGVVKTGTDGKKYKIVVYSTCHNIYFFE